jgi:dTDP-4-amino-4,6-dideoxygalactose transaminase
MWIPFNRPQLAGREHLYIDEALATGKLSGNGRFGMRCTAWLERKLGARKALMTPSCTAALEMTMLLVDLEPGDEVIVPSFGFVSVATSVALRRAVPVFADVSPDTLNIDPDAVAAAITPRTRAIVLIHYGGVACDLNRIGELAARHRLTVIEDAAHALPAALDGRPLGSIGRLAAFSFHETKNVHCGEGGALVVNDDRLIAPAEIVQEKGTDRARFFRGEVDRYTWRGLGSSYLMSEVAAAFLWAQLEAIESITARRQDIWHRYHEALEPLEAQGLARRPVVPAGATHSAHLYYLLLPRADLRDPFIAAMREEGVHVVFHYVPLHSSPAGRRLGRAAGNLRVTEDVSARLVRLPLWAGLADEEVELVIQAVARSIERTSTGAATSQR